MKGGEIMKKKGFTLIELMIVIAIIAILAAILVPNFLRARAQGQLTACQSNVKNIGTALEMYSVDYGGRYPTAIGTGAAVNAAFKSYMAKIPECPASGGTDDYGYQQYTNPHGYVTWCKVGPHTTVGSPVGFPQYGSIEGLVKDSTGISTERPGGGS
jgi:prepilin-type N-terminal cleavage/methylation domain-containing protein